MGRELWVQPSAANSLPRDWPVGYSLKPFIGRHKRGHLQLVSPHLDFVMQVLEACEPLETAGQLLKPEDGWNFVETPCTEAGGLARALEDRQNLADDTRPAKIPERHARGFQREVKELYRTLTAIVKQKGLKRPDPNERYNKYSGSKRAHYLQCAAENRAHPSGTRDSAKPYHEGMVKWGELSSRTRALLIQTRRAKGCEADGIYPAVKPGTPLRVPIAVEGGYRDQFEDALHGFCHARGYKNVASGTDLLGRGADIDDMVEPGDLVVSVDWKNFDGTLGWLAVWEREEFYRSCERLYGSDPALREVIDTQNRCVVQAGPLKAQIFGNRGSGTGGTSTGNKIVVLAAIKYCLGPAAQGKTGCKLYCDGDDTLIIVPRRWQGTNPATGIPWLDSWVKRFTHLGLLTKVEQLIPDTSEEAARDGIRFCRAGVIKTSRGWLLCKKPSDAMKVMTNFRRHFRGGRFADYLKTLSVGMNRVYGDVPILCRIQELFNLYEGSFDEQLYDSAGMEYMLQRHRKTEPGIISPQHRHSFWRTWGVTPVNQVACEQALDKLSEDFHQIMAARPSF